MTKTLARFRVGLGFACGGAALVLARPTWASWRTGLVVAIAGELIRIWAAGHLERWKGVTRSGPYRFVRHPLYAGSALLGLGAAVASRSVVVAVLTAAYLTITLTAAIRFEEAELAASFPDTYADYRAGRVAVVDRAFSWARVISNREYRAVVGLGVAFGFLAWRIGA